MNDFQDPQAIVVSDVDQFFSTVGEDQSTSDKNNGKNNFVFYIWYLGLVWQYQYIRAVWIAGIYIGTLQNAFWQLDDILLKSVKLVAS